MYNYTGEERCERYPEIRVKQVEFDNANNDVAVF